MTFLFYPSRVYSGRSDFRYQPERITKRIMLNPVYSVTALEFPFDSIIDSGAFQDIDKHTRLSPLQALDRQRRYREKVRKLFPGFDFEAVCIYDQMIGVDECIIDGKKVKKRGTIETGKLAIQDTLYAAYEYKKYETEFKRIVYIAQGITPEQYTEECVRPLLQLMRPKIDYFGFGGFCIIGKQRKQMLPVFKETCDRVFPLLSKYGIHRAHLLGICLPEAIQIANTYAQKYDIVMSTDSSAPEVNAVAFGRTYTDDARSITVSGKKWIDYNPIDLAHENVRKYNEWISNINKGN